MSANTNEASIAIENKHVLKKQRETSFFEKLANSKFLKKILYPPAKIAVIRLSGVIGQAGRFSNGLSLESLDEIIEKAFDLSKLKAVALIVNSPGGSAVQSELISKKIRILADEKKVPVYGFAEDVAASGGYWLLCSADEIYASENSIIGSIGVVSAGFGFQNAIEKLGVERRIYTKGKRKSILDPFMPEKKEDVKLLENLMQDVHESFKNMVKLRRKDKLNDKDIDVFTGEFWSGAKAKELGLIDEIGDFYTVMRAKFGKDVEFETLSKDKSWLKRKLGLSLSVASIVDQVLIKVEERLKFNRFGL